LEPQLIHLSAATETCNDGCANAFNFSLTVTTLKSAYMPDSAMLPHTFSQDGATYVVSFKRIGDQWRAALYKRDDGSVTELGPIAAEDLSGLSDHAIRAGYIGLAEWLVKVRAAPPVLKRAHLDDVA
jgi:hypothetical protein